MERIKVNHQNDGNLRKLIEVEHCARKKFEGNWKQLNGPDNYRHYKSSVLDEELRKRNIPKDVAPYEYTQEGDSFFVSKDMYDAMVGQCRCGQKKTYAHRVRCLRAPDKPLTVYEQEQKESKKENQSSNTERPRTSASAYGGRDNRYWRMELSTRYISPRYTMPGYGLSEHPYNNVFIG